MNGIQRTKSNQSNNTGKNGWSGNSNGDSATKVGDSNSVSEGENSALDKLISDRINHLQFAEVRFTPSVLEFVDAFQGKQFSEKVTVRNVGRNPILVRIGEPTSFMKKPSRRIIFLAAGNSITRTITYTYHNDDLVQKSRIPFCINGQQIDYPIVVKKATPELEVEPPQIDFGTINLGSEVKTLTLTIRNTGGTRSKYEIDVGKNDLDLVVQPKKGTVKAKSYVQVTVEMMGMKEGEFFKEIWIKTNGTPIRVPVLVEVVRPRLVVVYPNGTEELSAIDFPPTFTGTQKAVPLVLKNNSGEMALYVIVGEVNGEHQFLNKARKNHNIFNFFKLTAEEGRLEPHESRVLTAIFLPENSKKAKGWHHQENPEKNLQMEHVVFFTITRIHCIERHEIEKACINYLEEEQETSLDVKLNMTSTSIIGSPEQEANRTSIDIGDEPSVIDHGFRLCLRGRSVKPEILLQPSAFYLGEIILGQSERRVLTITNKSILRVKCVFENKMNVKVNPKQFWIGPEKVHEIAVTVTPSCTGKFKRIVKILILGESDVVYPKDVPLRKIAKYGVSFSFTSISTRKIPSPKIGLGLTPLIVDDVGINKELVTFNDAAKVPYAAKLLSMNEEFKPMWMRTKSAELDAMIALPNDRPRGLQTWPKNKSCRTIFKGWLRYSPPKDTLYTFSSEEQIAKAQSKAIWANYLLLMRDIRESYRLRIGHCKEAQDSCYEKHFKEYPDNEECFRLPAPEIKRKAVDFNFGDCLVPLSPMYLSHVVVEPKMINFGKVALKSTESATLKINNYNNFPTTIKFIPGNSAVTVNEDTVTVQSNGEKIINIWFQSGIQGRYYGFLNYVINGSHEFKITISAFVIFKTLIIEPKTLDFTCYPGAFQPSNLFLTMENSLQVPVSYKFSFTNDSPYIATLEEGQIPPRSKLLSEIVIELNPKRPLAAELKVISESGEKDLVKIQKTFTKLPVGFLSSRIDLKDVPLNLNKKVSPIIENESFHDVTFEVVGGNPMPGVTVEPKLGVIKARSFFPLHVQIQIPVVMRLTFEIPVIIQTSHKISVKITGNVVLPVIRINPSNINMRKICAQSFDIVKVCLENAGTTPSKIDIDFRSCPEYKILEGKSHLYLNPKQSTSLSIMFEPKDAARFVFYLPIIINNILGPPVMQETETENVWFFLSELENIFDVYGNVFDTEKFHEKVPLATLNCTVTSSLITVTPSSVTFLEQDYEQKSLNEEKPKENEIHFYFPPKEIVISNDSTADVTFCLRNDDLGEKNDSPFDLHPVDANRVEYRSKSMKATLRPGERLAFRATFSPKKPGQYSIQIPVYVRGYNDGAVYCYVYFSGKMEEPKLIPEADEIHFYPIPLNLSTELTFTITAENYRKVDSISCLICESKENENSAAQSLTTTWLETPEVTEFDCPQKFQIRIAFKSSVPAALRCYLVFIDSEKNYCSVLLTAVADNSSLTTRSFLSMKMTKYKINRPDCTSQNWKADEFPVLTYPFDKKYFYTVYKSERKSNDIEPSGIAVDKGPSLIVRENISKFNAGLVTKKKKIQDSATGLLQNCSASHSDSGVKFLQPKTNRSIKDADITYPYYPTKNDLYKKHCDTTLNYVEQWIYEVVMRCSQYYMLPTSFKISNTSFGNTKGKVRKQKDIINFLEEIFGVCCIRRINGPENNEYPIRWANRLFCFYNEILQLLESEGCLLPHVTAEYLLPYDEYLFYVQYVSNIKTIKPINAEPLVNKKFSLATVYSKPKAEIDENQVQKVNSSVSNKEFLSKFVLDALIFPSEVEESVEKVENIDTINKSQEFRSKPVDVFLYAGEKFEHRFEVLNEAEFNLRSTQAWLDVIIQIFRHVVLKKIVYKTTIPEVQVVEVGDKIPVETVEMSKVSLYGFGKEKMADIHFSNLYSVQERMLLQWLNHHLSIQWKQMWCSISSDLSVSAEKINNFENDLSNSVALISVTASYCPYVVGEYFRDCFPEPDTPNKLHHNAAKLIQAWAELSIGLTVKTSDIVRPNNVFMVMLVAQLYEILPAIHPRQLICFEASLSSQHTRKILMQCDLGKIKIRPKLFGEDSKYFKLSETSLVELKKKKSTEIKVTFFARKLKKIKATLLLSGCEESPHFGKGLAIFLEGQVTHLPESEKLSFSAPLYKVICTEIPIKPPYSNPATYELWYGTVKPVLSETGDFITNSKPWSKIWFRKVCRRLFLNKNEVNFSSGEKKLFVNVTVACFTQKGRSFWLLFRSKMGDFIVRIKIKSRIDKGPMNTISCSYPSSRPECLCAKTNKGIRIKWSEIRSCPFLTNIKIPSRNDDLWKALRTMFLKSLLPQEKPFWEEYFEKDIGICIIKWLLSPDEEDEVVDEFIPLLETQVSYTLSIFDTKKTLKVPPKVEIKDVRQSTETIIPIHLGKVSENKVVLDMVSENGKEVRRINLLLNSSKQTDEEKSEVTEPETVALKGLCNPCTRMPGLTAKTLQISQDITDGSYSDVFSVKR